MTESLGTVAVLDAHNLIVGMYVDIDGHICVVDQIHDYQVVLKPVTGPLLFFYHCRILWKKNWPVLLTTLLIGGAILVVAHFHLLERIPSF